MQEVIRYFHRREHLDGGLLTRPRPPPTLAMEKEVAHRRKLLGGELLTNSTPTNQRPMCVYVAVCCSIHTARAMTEVTCFHGRPIRPAAQSLKLFHAHHPSHGGRDRRFHSEQPEDERSSPNVRVFMLCHSPHHECAILSGRFSTCENHTRSALSLYGQSTPKINSPTT